MVEQLSFSLKYRNTEEVDGEDRGRVEGVAFGNLVLATIIDLAAAVAKLV